MNKSKLIEKFSVYSKYEEGFVTLALMYNEGNIMLNEIVKSVEDEQEAKLLNHAYYSLMIEKEMAIYSVTYYLAKVLNIECKEKNVNEVVKLIILKVRELKRVKTA